MSSEPATPFNELVRPLITRRQLILEVVVVMWVSLGAAAVRALLNFIERVSAPVPLGDQTTTIITQIASNPWLDLAYQLAGIVLPLGAVLLVAYLLHASGESLASLGVDFTQPRLDLLRGLLLAAGVGAAGLIFYLVTVRAGLNVQVATTNLDGNWYDIPILLLRAAEAGVLEEVVVLGYFIRRLRQIGLNAPTAIGISALLRGTYHLYQGLGGFVGNIAMGVLFGWLFLRWQRVMPMIIAHFLIDAVAFVGYSLLAEQLTWLPGGG
ncbi:CPBP family intramembrane metalloprotease [Candidatus Nanopelagicales bacterium]|nr:CPBP family intramembrane metalloprotease [Candidatus Nanopelagicales bacterium]